MKPLMIPLLVLIFTYSCGEETKPESDSSSPTIDENNQTSESQNESMATASELQASEWEHLESVAVKSCTVSIESEQRAAITGEAITVTPRVAS